MRIQASACVQFAAYKICSWSTREAGLCDVWEEHIPDRQDLLREHSCSQMRLVVVYFDGLSSVLYNAGFVGGWRICSLGQFCREY